MVGAANGRYEPTGREKLLAKNEAWCLIDNMGRWDTERSVLENVLDLGLCPQGMVSHELDEYIERENICETYKSPPAEGGIESWPALLYDAFIVIRQTHQRVAAEKARERRRRIESRG